MTSPPKLESLRKRVEALARVAREDPTRAGAELPSLLRELGVACAENGGAPNPSNTPTRSNDAAAQSGAANGERRVRGKARRAAYLRAAAERSQMLVRRMHTDQHCAWANRAWLEFTGAEPRALLGAGWLEHVHPDDREAILRELRVADEARSLYRAEYRLRDRAGSYAWVLEIGAPRLRDSGAVLGYLATTVLLTARRLVRERAERAHALVDASPEAILALDLDGVIVDVNPAAERCFGRPAAGLVGHEFADLIGLPLFRAQVRHSLEHYRATLENSALDARYDCVFRSAGGTDPQIEFSIRAIDAHDRRFLAVFARDAIERHRVERQLAQQQARLRALTADLLVVEERERRRLAQDLHDGMTQLLALLQLKSSALRAQLDGRHDAALDEIGTLLQKANVTARAITFELSPPMLHDLGLEPALQWLIENVQQRYGIPIDLEIDGAHGSTSERTRVILFRSIRELLINAAKHAHARKLSARLTRAADRIEVVVEDDGVGMSPGLAAYEGTGLISIRERIGHIGGSMRIDSAPGRGTRVHLIAPLGSSSPSNGSVAT